MNQNTQNISDLHNKIKILLDQSNNILTKLNNENSNVNDIKEKLQKIKDDKIKLQSLISVYNKLPTIDENNEDSSIDQSFNTNQ